MYSCYKYKLLGTHLAKYMKYLYNENYKTPKKEIEEDVKAQKDMLCSWIGRITIVKMSILAKVIYKSNSAPIKMLRTFYT